MDIINQIFDTLFNFIFAPFSEINAVWGMLVVSFLTSILMLLIFKATSDQAGIKRAKNHVKAHILAIRLYRDDIGLMFETIKNILSSNGQYLKTSLRPMLFLIVPVALVLIHLGARYEHRPLKVGERTVVTVQLDKSASDGLLRSVELIVPEGLVVETRPVRVYPMREINWRIRAEKEGTFQLGLKIDNKIFNKQLLVIDALVSLSQQVARGDFFATLMNPSEVSLPGDSRVETIFVHYPKRNFEISGFSSHWLVAFFFFSLLFAFSLKGFMRVEV
jgi:uncharacterized membrane protein (DUF106 family)